MTFPTSTGRPLGEIRPARLRRLSDREKASVFWTPQRIQATAAVLCSWDGCAGLGGYVARLIDEEPPPGVAHSGRDILHVVFPRGFRCSSLVWDMHVAALDGRPWRGSLMLPGGTARSYQLSPRAARSRRHGFERRDTRRCHVPPPGTAAESDMFGYVPRGVVAAPFALLEPDRHEPVYVLCPKCGQTPAGGWLDLSWSAAIEAIGPPVPQREIRLHLP